MSHILGNIETFACEEASQYQQEYEFGIMHFRGSESFQEILPFDSLDFTPKV